MNAASKKIFGLVAYIGVFAFTGLGSQVAGAQDEGEQLAERALCYACHQMDTTLLAPPYIAIAVRHAPRKEVMVDVLARKIVLGGGGNWGLVPMVPNQWVSMEEARLMSEWILSLAEGE